MIRLDSEQMAIQELMELFNTKNYGQSLFFQGGVVLETYPIGRSVPFFILGVFSGWLQQCSVLFIKTTYSREPWHCGVQRKERIVHAFA